MRANSKSNTYPEGVNVNATGYQESITNYPVRAVFTYDKYPTKEGNDMTSGVSKR